MKLLQQRKNKTAKIQLKLNNLVDKSLIQQLYKAALAGVKIELIIRGICCLDATNKKILKNISGKRIVDRYLEHSRIMVFNNGDKPLVYISSADWMPRNLDNRSEVAVPILDLTLKNQLISYFDMQFASNTKANDLWSSQDSKNTLSIVPSKNQKRFQRDYYLMMKRQN